MNKDKPVEDCMKEIQLLKNNDNRDLEDIEWVREFYNFLRGDIPKGIHLNRGHKINLSPSKAFSIIWYLQEYFPLLPDQIEQCTTCNELYDSDSSGYHSELTGKFYCNSCFPPFLDGKEEKILKRKSDKAAKTNP